MDCLLLSPGRSTAPPGTKTSRPEELEVMGTGSKKVLVEPLRGYSMWNHSFFYPSIPAPMNSSWRSTHPTYWTLSQSIYPVENSTQSFRDYNLIDFVVVSSKGHPIFLSGQLLQDSVPTITLLCLGSMFLGLKQYCVEFHGDK